MHAIIFLCNYFILEYCLEKEHTVQFTNNWWIETNVNED